MKESQHLNLGDESSSPVQSPDRKLVVETVEDSGPEEKSPSKLGKKTDKASKIKKSKGRGSEAAAIESVEDKSPSKPDSGCSEAIEVDDLQSKIIFIDIWYWNIIKHMDNGILRLRCYFISRQATRLTHC